MINAKVIYNSILNNDRILALVNDENIFDFYPDGIETFPCIIFQDSSQSEIEYADNKPMADSCNVTIHIFTKSLEGFPTTSEIGIPVCEVFKENYFVSTSNGEVPDPNPEVRHRVLNFRKEIFS